MKFIKLVLLGLLVASLLGLGWLALTAPAQADFSSAPRADVLPVTFTIRDRAGQVITTSLTIGLRVVDAGGVGVNSVPIAIEVCAEQNAPPCTYWVSRVTGFTNNIVEDGWAVAPAHNQRLYRLTCGTTQYERAVDGNTATLVLTCTYTPTAVIVSALRATSYFEPEAMFGIWIVSALLAVALMLARRFT